jgi:hypothetical protein
MPRSFRCNGAELPVIGQGLFLPIRQAQYQELHIPVINTYDRNQEVVKQFHVVYEPTSENN